MHTHTHTQSPSDHPHIPHKLLPYSWTFILKKRKKRKKERKKKSRHFIHIPSRIRTPNLPVSAS